MIGYTTIGVKDLNAAKQFYSELLDSKVLIDVGRLAMIGKSMGDPKAVSYTHLTLPTICSV